MAHACQPPRYGGGQPRHTEGADVAAQRAAAAAAASVAAAVAAAVASGANPVDIALTAHRAAGIFSVAKQRRGTRGRGKPSSANNSCTSTSAGDDGSESCSGQPVVHSGADGGKVLFPRGDDAVSVRCSLLSCSGPPIVDSRAEGGKVISTVGGDTGSDLYSILSCDGQSGASSGAEDGKVLFPLGDDAVSDPCSLLSVSDQSIVDSRAKDGKVFSPVGDDAVSDPCSLLSLSGQPNVDSRTEGGGKVFSPDGDDAVSRDARQQLMHTFRANADQLRRQVACHACMSAVDRMKIDGQLNELNV